MDSADSAPLLKGGSLTTSQIMAMFEKKLWYTIRNWILFIVQIIIPVLFLVITVLIVRTWAGGQDLPEMFISHGYYPNTVTVLEDHNSAPDSFPAK